MIRMEVISNLSLKNTKNLNNIKDFQIGSLINTFRNKKYYRIY